MKFKEAFSQTIEPITNFAEQLQMHVAYKHLDQYLKKESLNYQQLSEKIREDALKISETLGLRSYRNEHETAYMNRSYFLNSLRNELKEIGLLKFLRKHPEYRGNLSTTSKIGIFSCIC